MTKPEHLLTIVEPTTGGDATLDLAHDAVDRGGSARIVMVVTDRVRRDINDYAQSEDLDRGVAEAQALEQLRQLCATRVGGSPPVATHFGDLGTLLADHLTADTTAIAVPERLADGRWIRRTAATTGIPVTVTPSRAA